MPQSKTKGMVSQPGYGAVPPSTYANTTISSAAMSSGSGLTYSVGTSTTTSPWSNTATSGKLTLLGDDADLVINDKSLMKTLAALEERLNILVPNTALEKEWSQLKELGEQYRKLEADLKEKASMWAALKAEDR